MVSMSITEIVCAVWLEDYPIWCTRSAVSGLLQYDGHAILRRLVVTMQLTGNLANCGLFSQYAAAVPDGPGQAIHTTAPCDAAPRGCHNVKTARDISQQTT